MSLTATKTLIETLAKQFNPDGAKSVVVVASVGSSFVAPEQPVGYHVAKAGLVQMVRFYAAALGPMGVRVNAVSPGSVLKEEAAEFYRRHKKLLALYRRRIPLGRMGSPEDVADVIEFLCGPKAAFVTGQNIVVDGGLSLMGQESLLRAQEIR